MTTLAEALALLADNSEGGISEADLRTLASAVAFVDGSNGFTGVVSGVTPTADAHLATKAYVDSAAGGADALLTVATQGEVNGPPVAGSWFFSWDGTDGGTWHWCPPTPCAVVFDGTDFQVRSAGANGVVLCRKSDSLEFQALDSDDIGNASDVSGATLTAALNALDAASAGSVPAADANDVLRYFAGALLSGTTIANQGSNGASASNVLTANETSTHGSGSSDVVAIPISATEDGVGTSVVHYETATSPDVPNTDNGFTVSGYLKVIGALSDLNRIVLKQNSTSWTSPYYHIGMHFSGTAGKILGGDGSNGVESTDDDLIEFQGLTHIGVSVSADGTTLKLYVAGRLIGEDVQAAGYYTPSDWGTGPWVFGGRVGTPGGEAPCHFYDWRIANVERDADWFRSMAVAAKYI